MARKKSVVEEPEETAPEIVIPEKPAPKAKQPSGETVKTIMRDRRRAARKAERGY